MVWQSGPGVPDGALALGREADGARLFAARAQVGRALLLGRMRAGWRSASIPHDGREEWISEYEILAASLVFDRIPDGRVPQSGPRWAMSLTNPRSSSRGRGTAMASTPRRSGRTGLRRCWHRRAQWSKDFEVFAGDRQWVPAEGERVPNRPIKLGQEPDGEPLFVARRSVGVDDLQLGKLRWAAGAVVSFGGREAQHRTKDPWVA